MTLSMMPETQHLDTDAKRPAWYSPDGDDDDLILSATIDCGKAWGSVTITDPPESKRRRVQAVTIGLMKSMGLSSASATGGNVSVSLDHVDLNQQAALQVSKLAAYVSAWPKVSGLGESYTIPADEDAWKVYSDMVPGKVLDRVVAGIDIFTSAEGNEPRASSGAKPDTSSSAANHRPIGDTPGSSSTYSTRAEPGSSPPVEVFTTSPGK